MAPEGIPRPELALAGISTLIAIVSILPIEWAVRGLKRNQQRALVLGLALTFLLGAAAVTVYVFSFAQLNFTLTTNAYGSLFFTMGGFLALTALVGLGILAFVWYTARRGDYHAGRRVPVDNAARFWWFTVRMWVILFAILHLTPYVL